MNKRKIMMLALSLCMVAILAVGGTLAYFTDTDKATNVFTVGKVDITLNENFPANYDSNGDGANDTHRLFPGVDVTKEVKVTNNTGSEKAYVRVHIAIPSMLDSGSEDEPQFAAYNNTLHFNFTAAGYAEGQWNWNKNKDGANYPGNGGSWNEYQTTIDNKSYNVYVVTYETALTAGQQTTQPAITKVYLDTNVTNEMVTEISKTLGNEWKIYVVAEGAQAEGFDNAYDALNTAFGTPGTDGYKAPTFQ